MACVQTETSWTFHADDLDSGDVTALLDFHFKSMRANSPPDACHVLPADSLREPGLTFWSVRENGRLLGVGALKELSADHGEVKSMRTAQNALGRGVGSAMLAHIMAQARSRGYRRLSLETGSTEPFAAALHLYQRAGFVPCEAFGGYLPTPFTRFFTRSL
ncbi:MAG TPA: GNAT family N-acetyltransferase [Sphingomicrobium sp.]|nr:GNAT family N-acetyltransferase [Sphingomicrobium sp.]